MGLFKDIAEPLVSRGVPVIPLRPKTKIAFMTNWPDEATIDPVKIAQWDMEYVDANGACVARAKPDGVWFLELDRQGVLEKIQQDTGQKIPDTFMVRSSPGRGHFYWKQTPASIQMGNVQESDANGELWSARSDDRYVVAPGSFHPTTGKRYETLRDVDIIPAPDWLVQWCIQNDKTEKTGHAELDDETPIAEGSRNSSLASILGKARQVLGMDREQLYQYGLSVNKKRCRPPISDSEIHTIANSIGGYAVADNSPIVPLIGGVPAGTGLVSRFGQCIRPQGSGPTPTYSPQAPVEIPFIKPVAYPVFPRWIMKGTSLFEGLIGPVCEKNSRYPEFMFMPAVTLMLNYLALKVRIQDKKIIPSLFMVSIGRKGRVIKSSSVEDAIEYLHIAGIVAHASGGTKNAEGKALIWTVGSPEGLGLEMTRVNCKNAVLFYDELSTLTNKASIESSALASNLLTMYESGKFSNTIKSRKEIYNFDPGTYCASLIACTTDTNFHKNWSRLAGNSSGLDERFLFLYQPEILIPLTPYVYVNTVEAALKTRKLIDKAVLKGVYSITDSTPLEQKINRIGNRAENRAEKLALYFAVDLDRDEIDEECIERALAIAEYEIAVKKYLKTFEATTQEGALQNEIIQLLQRSGGQVQLRDINRTMHPERHGTSLWYKVFNGLIRSEWISQTGAGTKSDPQVVVLMRIPEEEE